MCLSIMTDVLIINLNGVIYVKLVILLIKVKRWLLKKPVMDNKLKNSKKVCHGNIYGHKTEGELVRTFNIVHTFFKCRFVLPLLLVGEYIFRKSDELKYIDLPQHKNIKLFNKSYDETIEVWVREFLKATYDKKNEWTEKDIQHKLKNDHSIKSLRIMKKLMLMMCQNDTAYLEFYNILSHRITKNMCEYYKDKSTDHVFYTSKTINDFRYFAITNAINGDTKNGKQE